MSELGRTIDVLKKLGKREEVLAKKVNKPLGIKTPLEKGNRSGETLFKMHFDIKDQIRDNLKNLIMTQKGERLGFPDFGTNLRQIYSNTSISNEEILDRASNQIEETVSKYIPNIRLINFYSEKLASQLLDGEQFDDANIAGYQLADAQSRSTFISPSDTKSNIEELNAKNPDVDSVYKITLEYEIPILDGSNQTLTLFVNTSK